MVFGGFVEMEMVTVGRYSTKVTPVYSVMRYLKSDLATGNVHITYDHDHFMLARWSGSSRESRTGPSPEMAREAYGLVLFWFSPFC